MPQGVGAAAAPAAGSSPSSHSSAGAPVVPCAAPLPSSNRNEDVVVGGGAESGDCEEAAAAAAAAAVAAACAETSARQGKQQQQQQQQQQPYAPRWSSRRVNLDRYHLRMCGCATRDEYWARLHERDASRKALVALLADGAKPAAEKQAAVSAYNLAFGKTLFSCSRCWLMPGWCVCGRMAAPLECSTKVVVHVHQDEWGKGSNSGCVLGISLTGAEVLMRGHVPHDARMEELLNDPTYTPAVLYPSPHSILPEQLLDIAARRTGGRVLVVAVDGTWQAANRMATKYPQHVHHVRLPPEAVLPSASTAAGAASQQPQPADDGDDNANADAGASSSSETASCAPSAPSLAAAAAVLSVGQQPNGAVSLLAPVRRYKGDVAGNGRVSTCEAAAALLALLEGPQRGPQLQDALLQNMKVKVDGTRLQAGKEQAYYTH